jgi:DNA primase
MNDPIAEIKSRLPIEDFISEYVSLKKAGKNFKGLSAFKQEKTPSFIVSPDKGIAYCFATQQGGDIFKMVQLLEGVDFSEALRILADKTGVTLDEKTLHKNSEIKKKTTEILEPLLSFYQKEFYESEYAKSYWKNREINDEITKKFEIGYAPNSYTAQYEFLQREKKDLKDAEKVGALVLKDSGEYIDRFRDRIMIPVRDYLGKLVGFGGRVLDPEKEPKYLNSPEGGGYNKSYLLFGLDKAKEHIKSLDSAVIVEGYMDTIAAFQYGITNTVAVSGTALTEQQITLLKRYTKNFILAFDSDSAGVLATIRSLELCLQSDVSVLVLEYLPYKDLDECMKHATKEQLLSQTISAFDFVWKHFSSKYDLSDIYQKKSCTEDMLAFVSWSPSEILKQEHLKKLSERLQVPYKTLLLEQNRVKTSLKKEKNEEKMTEYISQEEFLWGLVFLYPSLLPEVLSQIVIQVYPESFAKHIYKTLKDYYNEEAYQEDDIECVLDEKEKETILRFKMYVDTIIEGRTFEEIQKDIKTLILSINTKNLKREQKRISEEMKNPSLSKEEKQSLALKIIEINKLEQKMHLIS